MSASDIVIFGTGGFAREVHQIIEDLQADGASLNFLGFLDGNREAHGKQVHDFPVLGDVGWLGSRPEVGVVVGVGGTPSKRRIVNQIMALGPRQFPTIIHPRAWIGNRIQVGEGSIICAGTNATTDIRIDPFTILNLDCTVGHDTLISPFTTVAPSVNISGNVEIGTGCDLGTGGTIIQGIKIGHWTIIGAGAVVVRDIPPNVTAIGAPAKPIKERPEGWQEG